VIGLYGSMKRIVRALYQYPGGWASDKLGPKRALIIFTSIAIIGYLIHLFTSNWVLFLIGTLFVLVWDSMSQLAIFSLIGETLKSSRRAIGFSIQSILKRLPIIIAPPLGGYLIEFYGLENGMKIGFLASTVLALFALAFQEKFYTKIQSSGKRVKGSLLTLWKDMGRGLKQLLISVILARLAS